MEDKEIIPKYIAPMLIQVAEELDERVKPMEDAFRTLNKEMGQVQGELKWIRWLLMGVLASAIGQFFL